MSGSVSDGQHVENGVWGYNGIRGCMNGERCVVRGVLLEGSGVRSCGGGHGSLTGVNSL